MCSTIPPVAVIAGSGISALSQSIPVLARISYAELPAFPQRRQLAGHADEVLVVQLGALSALLLAGRFHLYEGATLSDIAAPIAVLAQLGVRALIATNAAGGLNPLLNCGDVLVISDVVNMTFRAFASPVRQAQPLLDSAWRAALIEELARRGIPFREGSYIAILGPTYETPAEVRFYRRVGDCIGMSTVHELQVAVHFGLRTLALSIITNVASDTPLHRTTHQEVLATTKRALPTLRRIIECALTTLEQLP